MSEFIRPIVPAGVLPVTMVAVLLATLAAAIVRDCSETDRIKSECASHGEKSIYVYKTGMFCVREDGVMVAR